MISDIFLFYYNNIIVTMILMSVVLIADFLMRRRSRRLFCIAWIFLLIRLLVPVSVDTGLGTSAIPMIFTETYSSDINFGDFNSGDEMYYDDAVNKSDADSGSDADIESDNMLYEGDEETQVAENDKLDVNKQISDSVSYDNEITGDNISAVSILAMVWLAGMLIIAIIIAVRYIPVYIKKRYAVKLVTEKNVYVWPDNTGACTIGIIRPKVYVPYGLDNASEHMIIEHERTHIRRKDHILAAGYIAALLINWLNPLMWVIVYRCRKDIELACDEEVLAGEEVSVRKKYAELLIQRLNENSTDSFPVLLSFGFGDIRARIVRIGREYKITVKSKAAMYIASLLMVALSMTACGQGRTVNNVDTEKGDTEKSDIIMETDELGSDEDNSEAAENRGNGAPDDIYNTGKEIEIGADVSVIDYADKDRVIFSDYTGLYVYDIDSEKIIRHIDAEKYGLTYTQGDNATWYTVNKKGDTVYVMEAGPKTKYVYDIDKDEMKESDEENPDPYKIEQDYLLRSDNEPLHVYELLDSLKESNPTLNIYENTKDGLVEVEGDYRYYGLAYSEPDEKTEQLNLIRINPDKDDVKVNGLLQYEAFDINESNKKNMLAEFSRNFINDFNGAIESGKQVSLKKYITNDNLLDFSYKMIDITHKKYVKGECDVLYGKTNEINNVEIEDMGKNIYHVDVAFSYQGSGMTCQLLIKKDEKNEEILDYYFGIKDGVDTFIYGGRTIDNPDIWNDEDWLKAVKKINDI